MLVAIPAPLGMMSGRKRRIGCPGRAAVTKSNISIDLPRIVRNAA
jgi:hypothetical protein